MPAKRVAWGTEEERYRRACMYLLVDRYLYYVLGRPRKTDAEYDRAEEALVEWEQLSPHLAHPNSPTRTPGSDRPKDYPRGVRWYVHALLGHPYPQPNVKFKIRRAT